MKKNSAEKTKKSLSVIKIPPLTEADIKKMVSQKIFNRGLDYFKEDAIFDIRMAGSAVEASVRGNRYLPYQVKIEFGKKGVKEAPFCSCPYGEEFLETCKHIVVVLLILVKKPEKVKKEKTLSELTEGLDKSHLKELLGFLVKEDRSLLSLIEDFVEGLPVGKNTKSFSSKKTKTAFSRQKKKVIDIMREAADPPFYDDYFYYDSYYDDWSPADEAIEEILTLINEVSLQKGKEESAIKTLMEIGGGYIQEWKSIIHTSTDITAPFEDLDSAWYALK